MTVRDLLARWDPRADGTIAYQRGLDELIDRLDAA